MARSGLGGGWECVFANDSDKLKQISYTSNWVDDHFDGRDVAQISTSDLHGLADLAWASFPCQDLSQAGSKAGIGKADAEVDEVTRSGAVWPFLNIIRGLAAEGRHPALLALENVVGLLNANGGADFRSLCTALSGLGYRFGAVVADAAHFVPQSRPRVFVIAVRREVPIQSELLADLPQSPWHPQTLLRARSSLAASDAGNWVWWSPGNPPSMKAFELEEIIDLSDDAEWNADTATDRLIGMMSQSHLDRLAEAKKRGVPVIGSLYLRMRPNGKEGNIQRAEIAFGSTLGCLRTPKGGASRQDVIEALYASSRSGAGEGEAVAIIGRAHSRRNWDVLRSMQEATFYDARLQQSWKGRVFTLRRPSLTSLQIGHRVGVVVSGAIPTRLEADFRATVELQGGVAFRRHSDNIFSPPVLGAVDVDTVRLVEALGWAESDPMSVPDGTSATRLLETKVRGEGYEASSWWDWSLGRFRVVTPAPGKVSLTRLVHPGGRDHDLYRVIGRAVRSFHSRHAAILDAHAQAGVPLFRYHDGMIVRIPLEGALPLEIAAALRLRTLFNGGATKEGWGYRAGAQEIAWLAGLLPGLIAGAGVGRADSQHLTVRRGRGARRPLWEPGVAAA